MILLCCYYDSNYSMQRYKKNYGGKEYLKRFIIKKAAIMRLLIVVEHARLEYIYFTSLIISQL